MKNKYEIQKELIVRNLEKDDLKGYLDNLIRIIYESYIFNDEDKVKIKVNELNNLIASLSPKYPFVDVYINYRIVIVMNMIMKSIFKRDADLFYPKAKYDIDFCPEELFSLNQFVENEKDMMTIFLYSFDEDLMRFMDFIKELPQLKYYYKDEKSIQAYTPRKMIAKVTDFMNDVKAGKYDGYLEVPEDYLIDDEDYLDRYTYCERRHKEAKEKMNASDNVFQH